MLTGVTTNQCSKLLPQRHFGCELPRPGPSAPGAELLDSTGDKGACACAGVEAGIDGCVDLSLARCHRCLFSAMIRSILAPSPAIDAKDRLQYLAMKSGSDALPALSLLKLRNVKRGVILINHTGARR